MSVGFLAVDRNRVMNSTGDAPIGQRTLKLIPTFDSHRVHVIHVRPVLGFLGCDQVSAVAQMVLVEPGGDRRDALPRSNTFNFTRRTAPWIPSIRAFQPMWE